MRCAVPAFGSEAIRRELDEAKQQVERLGLRKRSLAEEVVSERLAKQEAVDRLKELREQVREAEKSA